MGPIISGSSPRATPCLVLTDGLVFFTVTGEKPHLHPSSPAWWPSSPTVYIRGRTPSHSLCFVMPCPPAFCLLPFLRFLFPPHSRGGKPHHLAHRTPRSHPTRSKIVQISSLPAISPPTLDLQLASAFFSSSKSCARLGHPVCPSPYRDNRSFLSLHFVSLCVTSFLSHVFPLTIACFPAFAASRLTSLSQS